MKRITILLAGVLGISLAVLSLGLLSNISVASAAPVAGPDSATIVVQRGSGHALQSTHEVSFTAPISGLAALELSGLDVVSKDFGWGIAVCAIDGVGCPASDCFCDPNNNWFNSHWEGQDWWDDDAWVGYLVGAADTSLADGAVDGWYWGAWGDMPLPPPTPQREAAYDALEWLAEQQSAEDGGYGTVSASVESMFSIGANNLKAEEWQRSTVSPTLMAYMRQNGTAYSQKGAAEAGKMTAALVSAQGCLPYGAKTALDYYDPATGQFDVGAGFQTWGMIGTAAMSETIPLSATTYLKSLQQTSGGWEWVPGGFGGGEDTNTTALAIQALIAAGEGAGSQAVVDGLAWLKSTQNTDGGFPYDPDSLWGTDSDTNSTAYVVQAILASGQDPLSDTWKIDSTNPISYLLGMQLVDGSFEYQVGFGSSLYATQQAIPALLGKNNPMRVEELQACAVELLFLPEISK